MLIRGHAAVPQGASALLPSLRRRKDGWTHVLCQPREHVIEESLVIAAETRDELLVERDHGTEHASVRRDSPASVSST